MNAYQLPCSVPRLALQCSMIAFKLLLSPRLPGSMLCVRVSTLLSDAHAVVLFARQLQSSQHRLSSGARNVERNASSFCSAPGSHQEIFHSIRFILLSLCVGTLSLMLKPTVPEKEIAVAEWSCAVRRQVCRVANLHGVTQT